MATQKARTRRGQPAEPTLESVRQEVARMLDLDEDLLKRGRDPQHSAQIGSLVNRLTLLANEHRAALAKEGVPRDNLPPYVYPTDIVDSIGTKPGEPMKWLRRGSTLGWVCGIPFVLTWSGNGRYSGVGLYAVTPTKPFCSETSYRSVTAYAGLQDVMAMSPEDFITREVSSYFSQAKLMELSPSGKSTAEQRAEQWGEWLGNSIRARFGMDFSGALRETSFQGALF